MDEKIRAIIDEAMIEYVLKFTLNPKDSRGKEAILNSAVEKIKKLTS